MTENDMHRTFLALLLAVLDDDDERAHELLHSADDPHFATTVAHYTAHKFVNSVDEQDHAEMRADLAAELHNIAGED